MPETLSFALVLTARPGARHLDASAVASARAVLDPGTVLDEGWLGPDEAWQALLALPEDCDLGSLRDLVRTAMGTRPIDVNVIPDDIAYRRRKLFVSDMDSTIIEQECIDEMAAMLGIKPRIAAITERAMRGELDFEGALKERMRLLAGLSEAQLHEVFAERITLMPGARTLLATMRANGAFTALVSGGFTFFTRLVAEAAGFEANHANILEFADGRLTGTVVEPILGRDAKRQVLEDYRSKLGLFSAETLASGDGANDLAMLATAGLGVAYRAKPIVAAEAHASIIHGDLTALLYLQGYKKDEFVGS